MHPAQNLHAIERKFYGTFVPRMKFTIRGRQFRTLTPKNFVRFLSLQIFSLPTKAKLKQCFFSLRFASNFFFSFHFTLYYTMKQNETGYRIDRLNDDLKGTVSRDF
jgi:hypothetical protein